MAECICIGHAGDCGCPLHGCHEGRAWRQRAEQAEGKARLFAGYLADARKLADDAQAQLAGRTSDCTAHSLTPRRPPRRTIARSR